MNTVDASDRPPQNDMNEIARQARRITRQGLKAALATRDADTGDPFISMAGAATAIDGAPIMLMSSLARHRRNLEKYPQVSLLFENQDERSNPLTGARVSLSGRAELSNDPLEHQRFLARQPKAFYAGFSDFAFFRIRLKDAHFVGGFGIAQTLPSDIYLLKVNEMLKQDEGDLISMLNETRKDELRHMVSGQLGAPRGAWRITGIDPEGCDFMWKHRVMRFDFPMPAESAEQVLAMMPGL